MAVSNEEVGGLVMYEPDSAAVVREVNIISLFFVTGISRQVQSTVRKKYELRRGTFRYLIAVVVNNDGS